jgi:predicted TIM-barrel fold metal-dependent hydrolase
MTQPRLNWNRRELLQTSLAAAGCLTTGLLQTAIAADGVQHGWIDAHSHIWTRDIAKYPLQDGVGLEALQPPSFTTEELLTTAAKEGVNRVVLIAHNVFYGFDNTYMLDAVKQYPGQFRVVGMVDDAAPHPDVEMKRLLPLGVTGFRIVPARRGDVWLENPGMQAMWRCAAQTRQNICCLINPVNLAEVDQMCQRHPETPVVIDHFARIGVDGQIRQADLDQLCRLARHRFTTVKISAYYALGKKQPPYTDLIPMIRRLLDTFGPNRLMWASDSPYQLVGDNTYAASIALVRDHLDFISTQERQLLLRDTAARVFFFPV